LHSPTTFSADAIGVFDIEESEFPGYVFLLNSGEMRKIDEKRVFVPSDESNVYYSLPEESDKHGPAVTVQYNAMRTMKDRTNGRTIFASGYEV
jgi:hypothetical protein